MIEQPLRNNRRIFHYFMSVFGAAMGKFFIVVFLSSPKASRSSPA